MEQIKPSISIETILHQIQKGKSIDLRHYFKEQAESIFEMINLNLVPCYRFTQDEVDSAIFHPVLYKDFGGFNLNTI